jgi:hypothetical protein
MLDTQAGNLPGNTLLAIAWLFTQGSRIQQAVDSLPCPGPMQSFTSGRLFQTQ